MEFACDCHGHESLQPKTMPHLMRTLVSLLLSDWEYVEEDGKIVKQYCRGMTVIVKISNKHCTEWEKMHLSLGFPTISDEIDEIKTEQACFCARY